MGYELISKHKTITQEDIDLIKNQILQIDNLFCNEDETKQFIYVNKEENNINSIPDLIIGVSLDESYIIFNNFEKTIYGNKILEIIKSIFHKRDIEVDFQEED